MDTKEAIEFLSEEIERLKDWNRMQEGYLSKPTKTDIYRGKLIQVISLLQQGEKYKQMWEEFDDEYGVHGFEIEDTYFRIRNLMEKIEQRYFPKEG